MYNAPQASSQCKLVRVFNFPFNQDRQTLPQTCNIPQGGFTEKFVDTATSKVTKKEKSVS